MTSNDDIKAALSVPAGEPTLRRSRITDTPNGVQVGDRIRLLTMPQDPRPIAPGTEGTVTFITDLRDSFGGWQIGVDWDIPRGLMLSVERGPNSDTFEVLGTEEDAPTPTPTLAVLREHEAWDEDRAELSRMDAEGTPPRSSEWHDSDDGAVEIMHEAIKLLNELLDIALTMADDLGRLGADELGAALREWMASKS